MIVGWELMNEVEVNPYKPDRSREAEKQASHLCGKPEECWDCPPVRIFEEDRKLSQAENGDASVPNSIDVFGIEETLDFVRS